MYNRHVCNDDGSTPYEVINEQSSRGKLAEFGERVFYDVPNRLQAKLDLGFSIGVFIGNSQNSNEALIGIGNGNVIRSGSVVRVAASQRWSKDVIRKMIGIPGRRTPQEVADINHNLKTLSIHMQTKLRPLELTMMMAQTSLMIKA